MSKIITTPSNNLASKVQACRHFEVRLAPRNPALRNFTLSLGEGRKSS